MSVKYLTIDRPLRHLIHTTDLVFDTELNVTNIAQLHSVFEIQTMGNHCPIEIS
jgi:hypothetical protein